MQELSDVPTLHPQRIWLGPIQPFRRLHKVHTWDGGTWCWNIRRRSHYGVDISKIGTIEHFNNAQTDVMVEKDITWSYATWTLRVKSIFQKIFKHSLHTHQRCLCTMDNHTMEYKSGLSALYHLWPRRGNKYRMWLHSRLGYDNLANVTILRLI